MRLRNYRRRIRQVLLASVLASVVGTTAGVSRAVACCDAICPFNFDGTLNHFEPILDGKNCYYTCGEYYACFY